MSRKRQLTLTSLKVSGTSTLARNSSFGNSMVRAYDRLSEGRGLVPTVTLKSCFSE